MRVQICCSALALALVLCLPVTSRAQDPCPEAGARAADCGVHFCPLTSDPAACAAAVETLASSMAAGSCDPALAEQVRMATCAAVVDLSGGGGNACERAYRHIVDCLRPRCESNPEAPVCAGMLDGEPPDPGLCTAEAEAMSQSFLDQSCDEITTLFGL